MTREYREYAKSRIEYLLKISRLNERDKEALEMAIQALSQEPILDNIRAEIADLDDAEYEFEGYYKAVNDAIQIIDKYREEQTDAT